MERLALRGAHPRPFPVMNTQVVSGLMPSMHLGTVAFTVCMAEALYINFVNSAFPFKGQMGFGLATCLPLTSTTSPAAGRRPVVLQTSQLCRSVHNPWLSPAQALGSAMLRWPGHAVPRHPLRNVEKLGKSLLARIPCDVSPGCLLEGLGL